MKTSSIETEIKKQQDMFIRERIHTDTEANYFSLLPNLRGARITLKCRLLRALIQYRIIFF